MSVEIEQGGCELGTKTTNSMSSVNGHHTKDETSLSVNQMFEGRSIFVTGASGFIGRVLLVKLLSTYPGIRTIYILLRSKRNVSPAERLQKDIFQLPLFDKLKQRHDWDTLMSKIKVISGDLGEQWLGISDSDLNCLLSDKTLSIVFHCAATIKFDEPLRVSVKLNLIATKTIIKLCESLPQLISLCHVSTAYVNSDILDGSWIEERLYPIRDDPNQLIDMANLMDEKLMQNLKGVLVDGRPNTYTYTKALAEHLIAKEAAHLPIAIVRPSIVVAAWREPVPGWIDNVNGPTGLILAIGKGLLRTMHVLTHCKADIIPVDITVNTMIASSFYVAKKYHKLSINGQNTSINETNEKIEQDQPFIIHSNSGQLNPVKWGDIETQMFPIIREYPSHQIFRYPFGTFKRYKLHDRLIRPFVHLLPALIVDIIMRLSGKKLFFLRLYGKLHGAVEALHHFTTNDYSFISKNLQVVRDNLPENDRKILYTDIENLNWIEFWNIYVLGTRRYILKESDDNLAESRRSMQRALWIERAFRAFLCIVFVSLFLRWWPILDIWKK